MKDNEKKMLIILLIILVIAIIIFVVNKNKKGNNNENAEENNTVEEFVQVLEDGTKLNTSTKLSEAKEVNGLKFENMQLTEQNGQSVLLADVTNNSGKATNLTIVDVVLLDKNGQEIITVGGIISPLQAGEKTQFNTSMTLDYANAYDFKIVIK
ncbi:MAG: FxLYD domain-containing protein [Clostridia bacterium]